MSKKTQEVEVARPNQALNPAFQTQIKRWIEFDNQTNKINKELKTLRDQKNELQDKITEYVYEHKINKTIININDGKLRFTTTKTSAPLTLKYIQKCLADLIENEEQINAIMTYIKDNREQIETTSIKRTYNKETDDNSASASQTGDDDNDLL